MYPCVFGLDWPHLWGHYVTVKSYTYYGSKQSCVYIGSSNPSRWNTFDTVRNWCVLKPSTTCWHVFKSMELFSGNQRQTSWLKGKTLSKCFSNTPQELEDKSSRSTREKRKSSLECCCPMELDSQPFCLSLQAGSPSAWLLLVFSMLWPYLPLLHVHLLLLLLLLDSWVRIEESVVLHRQVLVHWQVPEREREMTRGWEVKRG